MIIEGIVCNTPETVDLQGFDIDYVEIEWYEVSKKILHKTSRKGMDVGIRLDMDRALKHGDILWIEGNKALVAEIPECQCIVLKPESLIAMGKACYEIGNRHAPLFYQNDELLLPYDEPMLQALKKCGFDARKNNARLISPLGGQTDGHSHQHQHGHEHAHSHKKWEYAAAAMAVPAAHQRSNAPYRRVYAFLRPGDLCPEGTGKQQ